MMKNFTPKVMICCLCCFVSAAFAVTPTNGVSQNTINKPEPTVKTHKATQKPAKVTEDQTASKKAKKVEAHQKKSSSSVKKNSSVSSKDAAINTEQNESGEVSNEALQAKVDRLERRFDEMTQNRDNPKGGENWFKHFRLGGIINVDAYDSTDPQFQTRGISHAQQFELATAKLNVDATVNDWVRGHMGLFYSSAMRRYYLTNSTQANSTSHGIMMDEAYIVVSNFKDSPFFLRAGQQYLPFGAYNRYPISETLTQELSETRAVSAELGFNDKSGLAGSVSALDGLAKTAQARRNDVDNYIAALSYENRNHPVGFQLGVSYINNMIDVGSISFNIAGTTYVRRVAGFAAHADVFTGPFDLLVRYVTALRQFDPADFTYQVRPGSTRGAKPSAGMVQAGYAFQTKGHDSKIVVSYQISREARNVNATSLAAMTVVALPKNRMSVGYGVKVLKNTIVAAEFRRDHDYSKKHGGTNRYDNTGTLRLTVLV